MDAATAALIGASLGAITTLVAGTVTPWRMQRARSQASIRNEQRAALIATFDALSALLRARLDPAENRLERRTAAVVAIQSLTLLVHDPDRHEVESILNFALSRIDDATVLPAATTGLDAGTFILSRWYRGELRGKAIGDAYTAELDRRLGEYAAR